VPLAKISSSGWMAEKEEKYLFMWVDMAVRRRLLPQGPSP
jgi:hypothetical protein